MALVCQQETLALSKAETFVCFTNLERKTIPYLVPVGVTGDGIRRAGGMLNPLRDKDQGAYRGGGVLGLCMAVVVRP